MIPSTLHENSHNNSNNSQSKIFSLFAADIPSKMSEIFFHNKIYIEQNKVFDHVSYEKMLSISLKRCEANNSYNIDSNKKSRTIEKSLLKQIT